MSTINYTVNRKPDGGWGLSFTNNGLRIYKTAKNKIPKGLKQGDKITHINNISVRVKQNILKIIRELNMANINTLKLTLLRDLPQKSNKETLSKHSIHWPNARPRMQKAHPRENRIQEVDESEFSSIKSKLSSSNSQPRSKSRPKSRSKSTSRSRSNSDQQMPFMTHHFLDFGAKKKPRRTMRNKSKSKSKSKSKYKPRSRSKTAATISFI